MKLSDYHFDLPESLIAQYPAKQREKSRLLAVEAGSAKRQDLQFEHLPSLLNAGDLLIFNDTKVVPARLMGHKSSGGKVEVLLERLLDDSDFLAQIRASKSPPVGTTIDLAQGVQLTVIERVAPFYRLRVQGAETALQVFEQQGAVPLPPYIRRPAQALDQERYQTVYAANPGAVAAPTAGLHFTPEILAQLEANGIQLGYLTLHVGAGTFSPVRAQELDQHEMHTEVYSISQDLATQIATTKRQGGRVIAVGTTVVRSLESAWREDGLRAGQHETNIFIHSDYHFNVVDALVTNFHLPESTLIMLVCAFGGYDTMMNAYRHAVAEQYRFFSYGDAMFIY